MNYHNKRNSAKLRTIFKKIGLITIFSGIIFISYKVGSGDWLIDAHFKDAKWYECNDPIDGCYTNENILHNKYNWIVYKEEVTKRSRLEKKSIRPDLDKDGSVCSCVSNK